MSSDLGKEIVGGRTSSVSLIRLCAVEPEDAFAGVGKRVSAGRR